VPKRRYLLIIPLQPAVLTQVSHDRLFRKNRLAFDPFDREAGKAVNNRDHGIDQVEEHER
jgi:hypothetical protein